MMRNFLMTALAGGALAVFGVVPDASARDYPFCFIGEHFPPPLGDCSYDTYQQCKAFAFGLRGYCDVNPTLTTGERALRLPDTHTRRSHRSTPDGRVDETRLFWMD